MFWIFYFENIVLITFALFIFLFLQKKICFYLFMIMKSKMIHLTKYLILLATNSTSSPVRFPNVDLMFWKCCTNMYQSNDSCILNKYITYPHKIRIWSIYIIVLSLINSIYYIFKKISLECCISGHKLAI